MFKFYEEGHKYIDDTKDISWTSITTYIHQFTNPFNKLEVATKCAKGKGKNKKYKGLTPEQIIEIWDEETKRASVAGSLYHSLRENALLSATDVQYAGKILNLNKSYKILDDGAKVSLTQKLEEGIYPEHMVTLESLGLCGQSDRVEVIGNKLNIRDYKGLSLDTDIPTKQGFKKMKDLTTSDIIFDGDGKETKIKNLSKIHHNPCFEIVFDTNDKIICDHEHRWVVKTNEKSEVELTTEELFELYSTGEKIGIKCTSIEPKYKELRLDPYVAGIWLGMSISQIENFSNNKSIIEEVNKRVHNNTYVVNLKKYATNLSKRLPDIYLRGSKHQRLEVLQGLMDILGDYQPYVNRCIVSTTLKFQADIVIQLVSSLGMKPSLDVSSETYTVTFEPIVCPFLTRKDECILNNELQSDIYRYIDVINKIETVPTRCIEVESDTHTYLCTKSYIKTHNTNKRLEFESYKSWDGVKKKMLNPLSHLDDCNGVHYQLQLSLYMYMILQHNPQLVPGKIIIEHITFKKESENEYGFPIYIKDTQGNPIPDVIRVYECKYMIKEVEKLLNHRKKELYERTK